MMSWVADLISEDCPKIVVNFPRLFVASDEFFRVAYLSYAIFPDGRIHIMEGKAAQQECYDYTGRKPQRQSYPRPGPGVQVEDELAKRRKRKQGGARW
jgi:hypothetical protein